MKYRQNAFGLVYFLGGSYHGDQIVPMEVYMWMRQPGEEVGESSHKLQVSLDSK